MAQHHTHVLLALGLALMPPLRPAIAQGGVLKGCPSVLCWNWLPSPHIPTSQRHWEII